MSLAAQRARAVVRMAATLPRQDVSAIIAGWLAHDRLASVEIIYALARMVDEDQVLRDAHAAYNAGSRTDEIVALEREYNRRAQQRLRAAKRQKEGAA